MVKKKILILGMSSTVGGVETFILDIIRNIHKRNFEISILLQEELIGYYKEEIDKYADKIFVVGKIKQNPFKTIKKLKNLYKKEKFDIIHINLCMSTLFLYAILGKVYNKKTKIITHSHNNSDVQKLSHFIFRPLLLKYSDVFFACSEIAAKWMFGNRKNVVIIKNSINSIKYKFDQEMRNKIRKELNINNEKIIMHIGRFEQQKNHKFLIEIFREVINIDDNFKLILIGTGNLLEDIKSKVKNIGIEEKVIFLNIRNDINELLQAADIFILPSLFEGFGIVGLEAQASGLYTITSNNVAKELKLTDYYECLSLNIGSKEWAKEIIKKINVKIDREKAYLNIERTGYDLKNVVNFLEKYYLDL